MQEKKKLKNDCKVLKFLEVQVLMQGNIAYRECFCAMIELTQIQQTNEK
jgi:hypothetical protein